MRKVMFDQEDFDNINEAINELDKQIKTTREEAEKFRKKGLIYKGTVEGRRDFKCIEKARKQLIDLLDTGRGIDSKEKDKLIEEIVSKVKTDFVYSKYGEKEYGEIIKEIRENAKTFATHLYIDEERIS